MKKQKHKRPKQKPKKRFEHLLQKANHQTDGEQSRLRTKEKLVQHKTHIKDIKNPNIYRSNYT